jgi:hypothetical protein
VGRIGGENDRAGGAMTIAKGRRANDGNRQRFHHVREQQRLLMPPRRKKVMVALADGVRTKSLVRWRIRGEKRFWSKMKTRNDGDEVQGIVGKRKKILTLKIGSIYHVMNSTCIHLKAKDLNIYMYRRRRIYKEPLREIQ